MNPYFQTIETLFKTGEMLEAERMAESIPKNAVPTEEEQLLVLKIKYKMTQLRIWNIEGRNYSYCDPPSWESQPKFQKCLDIIKDRGAKSVLDVGCFTAYLLRRLKKEGIKMFMG